MTVTNNSSDCVPLVSKIFVYQPQRIESSMCSSSVPPFYTDVSYGELGDPLWSRERVKCSGEESWSERIHHFLSPIYHELRLPRPSQHNRLRVVFACQTLVHATDTWAFCICARIKLDSQDSKPVSRTAFVKDLETIVKFDNHTCDRFPGSKQPLGARSASTPVIPVLA